MKKICQWCNKEFWAHDRTRKFCSRQCSNDSRRIGKYQKYLKDNSITWGFRHMRNYKNFFLEEQHHKCAICGIEDLWNGKQLVFILDHIDGNADNNNRDNLRLICPNCDSQLDTYKSKNKNSARRKYRVTKIQE